MLVRACLPAPPPPARPPACLRCYFPTPHLPPLRAAVTNLAQSLVFSTWGFMGVAVLGIAITYNM